MKIIITGATGMVGNLVLQKALASDKITEVISFSRKPTEMKHQKINEFRIEDFENYSPFREKFKNVDIGIFCIGVYTGAVKDEMFKKITVDYAVAFAHEVQKQSPKATLCLLSGAGADRTEKSKTAFAKYKGMAENKISKMDLAFYSFRPAYIYPVVPRKEPNIGYKLLRIFYPVLKLFGKKYSIKSTELASAILNVGINGADNQILENKDILKYINTKR